MDFITTMKQFRMLSDLLAHERPIGQIAQGFKWSTPSPIADRNPREVLIEEGVTFEDKSLATEELRLTPEDILELIGQVQLEVSLLEPQ